MNGVRWAGIAAVVVAAMSLGRLVSDVATAEPPTDPFVRSGEVGDVVSMKYAQLEVTDVRGAATLDNGVNILAPAGRFVVVDVELTTTRETTTYFGGYLVDSEGRRFVSEARMQCAVNPTPPVGLRWRATYCFDVSRDAVEGMRLVLARSDYGVNGSDQRRDEVASIDLGIDRETADRWWASEERITPDEDGPA